MRGSQVDFDSNIEGSWNRHDNHRPAWLEPPSHFALIHFILVRPCPQTTVCKARLRVTNTILIAYPIHVIFYELCKSMLSHLINSAVLSIIPRERSC